jgi:hypothetical protein
MWGALYGSLEVDKKGQLGIVAVGQTHTDYFATQRASHSIAILGLTSIVPAMAFKMAPLSMAT